MGKKFNLKDSLANDAKTKYETRDNYGARGENYIGGASKLSFFKVKKGTNKVDIIPFKHSTDLIHGKKPGEYSILLEAYVHRYFNQGGDKVVCPQKTSRKPCPICEEQARLREKDADEHEDRIKELNPSKRVLMNVVNLREDEDDDDCGQVQVFDQSYALFAKKLLEDSNETDDGEPIDFYSPDEGTSVKFKARSKKLGQNNYFDFESFEFPERDNQYNEGLVEFEYSDKIFDHGAYSLDGILKVLSYEELEALLNDDANDDEGEDEDDEEIEVPRNAKKHAKKAKPEPEEEDEDEEEEGSSACPYGHTFGDDNMETKDCATCKKEHRDVFKECVIEG